MYRNVWPLATVDLVPKDDSEGPVLWIKLGLLTLGEVVIPLFSPRKYVPIDAKNPTTSSPEQIASLGSLLFYGFMEPLIWSAQHLPHLTYDMLSPLANYNRLQNLVGRAFLRMDPTRSKTRSHMGCCAPIADDHGFRQDYGPRGRTRS
ncbi:hypothetical protein GY45DRAFT_1285407 [Cubamyces sp. BRFM 1775]|nr:hypothetical protein GY45DRAFT_1285407 [Cubamyces sp. BRFM 1775]